MGREEGVRVGLIVGANEGFLLVGITIGERVGDTVGLAVGFFEGENVGPAVGLDDLGAFVGGLVGTDSNIR